MTKTSGTRQLWSDSDAAFAALLADPDAWVEYVRAGAAWDAIVTHDAGDGGEAAQGEPTERPDPSRASRSW
jgi:hypothetical protein